MQLTGSFGARRLGIGTLLLVVLSAVALSLSAAHAPGVSHFGCNTVVCASVTATGVPGDSGGGYPDLSADGRYVVFQSESTNLEPGVAGGSQHVYRRDLATGHTVRVSVSAAGTAGNGLSYCPVTSGDGSRIAYFSSSTNLVAGDSSSDRDVYAWDAATGAVTLVSVSTAGVKGDAQSYWPSISENGRYIAVESDATNLDGPDDNGNSDIYLRDLTARTTERISVSTTGGSPDGASWEPKVSADGRYVMFYSDATNLVAGDTNADYDVFVRDTVNNTTTRVSVADDETQIAEGATGLAMTSDGRYVLFNTWEGLAAGDTNSRIDIYLRDCVAGTTELVSQSSLGVCGNNPSYDAAISGDGRYVLVQSYANNLASGDINSYEDLYLRDRTTGMTHLVSKNAEGIVGNAQSVWPMMSKDGRYFGFLSSATNYVDGDINGDEDVFVRDRMQAASSLTLTSASQTLAKYGAKYTLTGGLSTGGSPLVGEAVKVQQAPTASGPWSDTSAGGTTGAGGSFAYVVAPVSATYYRVVYGGSGLNLDDAVSVAVKVTPRAWVGNPAAPSKMSRKKSYTVSGLLKPKHSVGSYPVRIYKYRKVGSKWKSEGYVKARASKYGSYSKYSAKVKLTKKGKWRLRAYAPADSGHAATWSSGYDYVTVK